MSVTWPDEGTQGSLVTLEQEAALAPSERFRLAELEKQVERGLESFINVGLALAVIREDRLYRGSHGTFESYLDERWGIARRTGYQLIAAAEVVEDVRNCAQTDAATLPANEAQARPLTTLPRDERATVWQEAVETAPGGKVTAAHVQSVVERHTQSTTGSTLLDAAESAAPAHRARRTDDRQTWATPQALFDLLDAEFGFTVDVAASQDTAKCERYFTEEADGLAQSWDGEVCFCNPPYGDKRAWVSKGHDAAQRGGATVVFVIPATPDTALWWDYCRYGEVRFLRGRLKFDDGGTSAPFPSALVIFRPGIQPADSRVVWWEP